MKKIKVMQFGLGAMGSMMAKIMLEKKSIELIGAAVRDESKNGKDIGELIGLKKKTGVKATTNAKKLFKKAKGGVMLHAAVSYVPDVWKQIKPAVEAGINVITIAEEMGYPFAKYPKICKEMDALAKKKGVSILGTGINPGFAMDLVPVMITGICKKIERIKVVRFIDFSPFGEAIQKNIGIGMSVEDFKKGVKEKKLPLHLGLPESSYMIAKALGWKITKIRETREPVIDERTIEIPGYKKIESGKVCGFDHKCYASVNGKEKIILEELGRVDPRIAYKNTIIVDGEPKIIEEMNVPSGELTTTSHAVNLIPVVLNAKPGLLTMLDIPPAPAIS